MVDGSKGRLARWMSKACDGLWDAISSEEAAQFVHARGPRDWVFLGFPFRNGPARREKPGSGGLVPCLFTRVITRVISQLSPVTKQVQPWLQCLPVRCERVRSGRINNATMRCLRQSPVTRGGTVCGGFWFSSNVGTGMGVALPGTFFFFGFR